MCIFQASKLANARRRLLPKNHDRGAAAFGTQHRPILLTVPGKFTMNNICRLSRRAARIFTGVKLRNRAASRLKLLYELRRQRLKIRRQQSSNDTVFFDGDLPAFRLLRF